MSSNLPPNAGVFESHLIGAIMENPRRFFHVRGRIKSEDIFVETSRLYYAALEEMDGNGCLVDIIEVAEERFRSAPKSTYDDKCKADQERIRMGILCAVGHLTSIGKIGPSASEYFVRWCLELEHDTPANMDLDACTKHVADASRVRKLQALCRRILADIHLGLRESDKLLTEAIEQINSIPIHLEEESTRKGIRDIVIERFEQIRVEAEDRKKGIVRTVSTGFRHLDELTNGGLRDSELWVLAARPGAGKTCMSLNISVNVAAAGHGVLFYSLEMGRAEIHDRILSSESSIPLSVIKTRTMANEDWPFLTNASAFIAELPLVVDWQAGIPLQNLRARTKRDVAAWESKHKGKKLRLVVVDYLQKITTPHLSKNAMREQQVSEIARGLKDMAKELDVAVLALAQMGRDGDKHEGTPLLSHLRESGTIEAEANLVAFLTPKTKDARRHVEMHIVKQRDGAPGMVLLDFDGPHVRFHDHDHGSAYADSGTFQNNV